MRMVQLHAWVTPADMEFLRQKAKEQDETVSHEIRRLIRAYRRMASDVRLERTTPPRGDTRRTP